MPQGKSSFWWKNILKLCEAYRGVAMCKIGDGSSVLFWTDVWNDQRLCQKFPRLFSYANNKNVSVAQFLMHNQIEAQFIYLSQSRPFRSTMNCNKSFNIYKF
jgi:hypothetical protein